MLGNAAAMGWTPLQLLRCGASEYRAAVIGWNRARGVPPPLERAEVDRVRALVAAAKRREQERRHGRR